MIKFVRVNKHPDHGRFTWFRLFIDGELVTNFEILDEYADRFERGTVFAAPDAAIGGYQPTHGELDSSNLPRGGSGVPKEAPPSTVVVRME